jgi:hypothetical protein
MKPETPPTAWGRSGRSWTTSPAEAKQKPATMRMRTTLSHGEDELEVAGFLDAEVVESGDEPGDGDGEDLRPEDAAGPPMACDLSQWKAGKKPRVRARPW